MRFSDRSGERSMQKNKYELRFLPLFYEEFDHAVSYIAFKLQNPDAANRLIDDVENAVQQRLADGPEMFEPVPSRRDRLHPYYRIYVKNFIIYYVVLEEDGKKIMEARRFMHALEDSNNKI